MKAGFRIVFFKEMRDILRDRKTLLLMIVLPIVAVPLLLNLLIGFVMKQEEEARTEVLQYVVFGSEYAPELAKRFEAADGFKKVSLGSRDELAEKIRNDRIDFGLLIPEKTLGRLSGQEQATIEFHFDNASAVSRVQERVGDVVGTFNEELTAARLTKLGVPLSREQKAVLEPVRLEEKGTGNLREVMGDRIGGMIPYFFIAFCFMGVVYPAIHLGAGEKERGTLETLLLAPVPRHQLVLGKFLAVFSGGVIAVLLNLASVGTWLAVKAGEFRGVLGSLIGVIDTLDLVLLALMLIPVAAMFAALLLSVSIFARNSPEASTLISPFGIVLIVPAVLALLPGVELNWFWAWIPVTNVSLAMKELLKGTMDYSMLLAIFASSTFIAAGLLFFCAKWFNRENVLFRV
ncbi:MAG: ABC transporter permease [Verrucomicrobiota bacterium]|nr:ABC transporter permease [Verrucomicrobiota bacterium]